MCVRLKFDWFIILFTMYYGYIFCGAAAVKDFIVQSATYDTKPLLTPLTLD